MATKTTWMKAAGLAVVLAVGLTFLLEPVNLPAGLHGPDNRSYLSQLYSLYFEHSLLLDNAKAVFGQPIIVTSTGYVLELRNIGTALAFLPFYALGHLLCSIGGEACAGGELPVGALLSLGNWLYGLLALVVIYRLAERYAPRPWPAVAVAVLAVGSSFFYYWTRFFSAHMPALLLVALLVLTWDRTRTARSWHHWLLMGVLGGLATTMASYNVVFLLLPAGDLVLALRRRGMAAVGDGLALGAGGLAGVAPQMVAWQLMFGSFLGTPYSRQLMWLEPGLPDILISSYHGLYFYTPALAVATLGFVPLYRRDRALAAMTLLVFAAHVYVSSCNIAWWGGASFGARYLLSSLPLLALPLAALLASTRWRGWLLALLGAGLVWGYGLFLADFARLIDPGQYIPPRWQLGVQVQVLQQLPELVRQHLLTPRFDAAPVYALPAALIMSAVLAVAWRLPGRASRWLAAVAVATPLAVAGGLILSHGPSQVRIAQMEADGILAGHARADFDLYDLSEGYRQRGGYRFVRGDLDGAHADWDTAHELLPSRDWVRFHQAGRRHVPHPLAWQVDERLVLVGWSVEPGMVTLYWLAAAEVLGPSYRTELQLFDGAGVRVAGLAPAAPDPWRALAGDIVRIRYPLEWQAADGPRTMAIAVHTADGTQVIGSLEVGLPAGASLAAPAYAAFTP